MLFPLNKSEVAWATEVMRKEGRETERSGCGRLGALQAPGMAQPQGVKVCRRQERLDGERSSPLLSLETMDDGVNVSRGVRLEAWKATLKRPWSWDERRMCF